MNTFNVPIIERIFSANDQLANENKKILDNHSIFAINIMASPGAGKTSLILKTIQTLAGEYSIGVIEGDTAPVTIDADKIISAGIPAVHINTGGDCHLDAQMIGTALSNLPLNSIDLLIVENVGNLICPAAFNLGTHANILIASVPEGDDKPYKYPNMYRGVDVLILNKMDLLPYIDFNEEYFMQGVRMLNPEMNPFKLSCKTGAGMDGWLNWLKTKISESKTK